MNAKPAPPEITRLLQAAADGEPAAMDQVVHGLYQALHQLAAAQLGRERHDPMLSATVLINEAWLKLFAGAALPPMENRGHLLGLAAHAMRQVLIDHARRRMSAKRPQDQDRLQLTEVAESLGEEVEPDALEAALDRLATLDERQARIVDMRFFAGLTGEQIAAATGLSTATVQREWRMARAWLRRELEVD
ncbi:MULTISPECIES: ECF-type sigma factor [unclassified Luteimonas]